MAKTTEQFTGIIKLLGVNPYVVVSRTRAQRLKPGWRKPMPVLVQVNGQPEPAWHINMMPVGDGSFYLYLHGDVRKASHTTVGDRVNVSLQFDGTYKNGPQHPMPSWFRIPLSKLPKAKQALAPSRQKEILRYLAALKSHAARKRNVSKALWVLSGKQGRFMARSWRDGA